MRNWQAAPISAYGAVEHPCWDFKKPIRGNTREATAENIHTLGQRRMDMHMLSEPGMPRIQKLANLGPVGVLSSCCTTPDAHIHPLTGGRRIRPTSTR